MGFVGNLFDSDRGMGFNAQKVNVLQPVGTGQTDQAYSDAQHGLRQQQDFLNAVLAQGGLQNQSSVFGQQQGLAGLLGAQAMGYGPNPALQQLQNTTGQNISNQAALMAGQRGSGANAGLIARQASMQGAGIQQQAIGQGAVLRAQQQLAAQQALQAQQANMANLSSTQVGQQANAVGQYTGAAQKEQELLQNALARYNDANVNQQNAINSANAGIANTTSQGQQAILGGSLKAVSGGVGSMMGASGGLVPKYADGGLSLPPTQAPHFEGLSFSPEPAQVNPAPHFDDLNMNFKSQESAPLSDVAKYLQNDSTQFQPGGLNWGAQSLYQGVGSFGPDIKKMMQAAPALAAFASKGGAINGEMLASQGKMVPGKAKVKGDSLKNDTVPAMLSPGEVVIPRHVMQSSDPVGNSARFVQAILAKNGMKK